MWAGFWVGMERFRVARALRSSQPNILKYIKDEILSCGDKYSLLCFHYFISPWYKPPVSITNHSPTKKITYKKLWMIAIWDKNVLRWKCGINLPLKKMLLCVARLRQSSQKASHEATNSIRLLMDEGTFRTKPADNMGPTRGQPSIPPHCWNQVHRIPHMSWYQNPKVLEPMTLLHVWKVEKK